MSSWLVAISSYSPKWRNGAYRTQPPSLKIAAQILLLMGSNPLLRYQEGPSRQKADELLEREVAARLTKLDANDLLYSVESSYDYDPEPGLEKIRAPLLALNFADDLINPPELGILERQIKRVHSWSGAGSSHECRDRRSWEPQ